MSKEIVVNKGKQTRIAIVENGDLAELFIENQEHERTIGNIFLGRIRRIMPSIQAAFVDIGQKQDAFLHFSDLIENVEDWIRYAQSDTPIIGKFKANYTTRPTRKKRRHPSGPTDRRSNRSSDDQEGDHHLIADERRKDKRKSAQKRQHGRHQSTSRSRDDDDDAPYVDPTTILKKDQPILVKISKEPIANKGSRITTDISLAGRFLVLVPMANYVAVSKKILSFKERRRLRALARSLLPEGFGVIVRTVADGRSAKALDTDLNLLIEKWKKIEEKLLPGPKAPTVIHEDVNMVSSIMRDLFTEDYDRIMLDDQRLYRNIKGYVQAIAPDMVADVKFHPGPESIFEKVGIAQAVEEAFDSRVNLPSGGYLFVEQTEAMHVIDVNSGRAGRGLSQEENSLRVNLEAAKALSKQVRLRDLGGIIVVDFIDMRNERNRRKVYESLKTEFRKDRAVTKVLPMSDFGLIQITRQRLRPSITTTFSLPEGTDAVPRNWGDRAAIAPIPKAVMFPRVKPEEFGKAIEDWFQEFKASGYTGKVKLILHPFAAAYFRGGFLTQSWRWFFKYGIRVEINPESEIDPFTFRFLDAKNNRDITVLPKLTPEEKSAQGVPTRDQKDAKSSDGKQRSDRKSPGREDRNRNSSSKTSSAKEPGRSEQDRRSEKSEGDSRSSNERDNRSRGDRGRDDSGRGSRNRGGRGRDAENQDSGNRDSRSGDSRSRDSESRDSRSRDNESRNPRKQESDNRGSGNRDTGNRDTGNRDTRSRDSETSDNPRSDSRSSSAQAKDSGKVEAKKALPASNGNARSDSKPEPKDLKAPSAKDTQPKQRPDAPETAPKQDAKSRDEAPQQAKVPTEKPRRITTDEPPGLVTKTATAVKKPTKTVEKRAKKVQSSKATSSPSRHRLEKYDFSQATLAKESKKQVESAQNESVPVKEVTEDNAS